MTEIFIYNNTERKNSKKDKILGVIIDNKVRFKGHVKDFSKDLNSVIFNKLLKRF